MNIAELNNTLKSYGKVEQCEEKDNKFHVKITTGFNENAANTFDCMGKILEVVNSKYPTIDKCNTDKNLFHLILKPNA